MSLRRRGLPALRPENDNDDYDYASAPESRALSRIDVIEDRLHHQEKTTKSLIDRAFKIKEDILDSFNINHGTWQEEKQARGLLQDHIRTITEVVTKLSRDIVVLEQQMQMRGGALAGTSNAVRSLEVQQAASLTDVRGRVARCDVALSKLASDMKTSSNDTKTLGQVQHDFSQQTIQQMKIIDAKIADLNVKLEKSTMEQLMKLQNLEGGSNQGLSNLNNRTQSMVNELKNNLSSKYAQEESHREKMEHRIVQIITKYADDNKKRQDFIEKKMDEALSGLHHRISGLEGELHKEKDRSQRALETLETKLLSAMEKECQKQTTDTQRLRKECREGFSTIHESLDNVKQVMEGKRRILEEQLRKEISQIRKMVVLV